MRLFTVSFLIFALISHASYAGVYECYFAQVCGDSGERCRLVSMRMIFNTNEAEFVNADNAGKIDALFLLNENSSGLLSIFPEDEFNPPNQTKFTVHSRKDGPTTIHAETFHGVCTQQEN